MNIGCSHDGPRQGDSTLVRGDDVFISYSRADAASYAALLANELAKRGFSCRFDQWASKPGAEVPQELLRALSRSGLLVVVSAAGARASGPIKTEIRRFLPTGRNIVPIDLDGTIRAAHWWPLIDGLAISKPEPLSEVLERIENTANFTRRNARLTRLAMATFAIFGFLVLLSITAGKRASDAIALATTEAKHAEEASQDRVKAKSDRNVQRELASKAADEAQRHQFLTAAAARDRQQAEKDRDAQLAQNYWRDSRVAQERGQNIEALHFAAESMRLAPFLREAVMLDHNTLSPWRRRNRFDSNAVEIRDALGDLDFDACRKYRVFINIAYANRK